MSTSFLKKFRYCLLLSLVLFTFPLFSGIRVINSFSEIEESIRHLDEKALVVLDVDEVILMDQDAILKPMGDPLKFQIFNEYYSQAQTPKEKEEVSNLLSLSLLLAKKQLVEEKLPLWIKELQQKKIKVIALTSCPTQSFGYMDNFEQWRLTHMRDFDIHLERSFPSFNRFTLEEIGGKSVSCPIYNKGVLFTEGFLKSEVLGAFLRKMNFQPSYILFVDDTFKNVQQMENKLNDLKIPHACCHYQRVEKTQKGPVNEKIARHQFEVLFKHQKWLSDQEAALEIE